MIQRKRILPEVLFFFLYELTEPNLQISLTISNEKCFFPVNKNLGVYLYLRMAYLSHYTKL